MISASRLESRYRRTRHPDYCEQIDRFIREVKPDVLCRCGHTAEFHDVEYHEADACWDRPCDTDGCKCPNFTPTPR